MLTHLGGRRCGKTKVSDTNFILKEYTTWLGRQKIIDKQNKNMDTEECAKLHGSSNAT